MIAPGPKDILIKKQKPSGFFGSNLASYLTLLGADSVVVVGTTTSGCVRATVIDAFSLNYRVILAEEASIQPSQLAITGHPDREVPGAVGKSRPYLRHGCRRLDHGPDPRRRNGHRYSLHN